MAVVALLFGSLVMVVAGGTFVVIAARFGIGTVEFVVSDSRSITFRCVDVRGHVQMVELAFHHVWLSKREP
uniref:Uncharacterized protein MANES_12G075600 n=1 Tax=Rhizophora mucronata TaxID=61149 RepID=A0A2P2K236_RHIMU